MTLDEILAKLETLSPEECKIVQDKVDQLQANIELRRRQVASGEGAVIPGDETLLQQAQSQQ